MPVSPQDSWLEARILGRKAETDRIISLELAATGSVPLPPFTAGAHIDVEVYPGCVRQYSLCGDPAETGIYRLGILRDPASRGGSDAIHAHFQPGQLIRISPPRNLFPLEEGARCHILVAGGIGVTPMLAMAHRLAALGADFDLHYCCRSAPAAGFPDVLSLPAFAGRVRWHFDDASPPERFDSARDMPWAAGSHLYVCGPAGFMDFVLEAARAQGWPPEAVHSERFSAEVQTGGGGFELRAARSGLTLTVPEDKTIAEVLKAAGVPVTLSCEQGVCGSCLTRVLEGVPDHRDMILTDEERASGQEITICCSRALTPSLTLDI